jgi:dTDP-N-acetylfucosamine:lipid II N-acetylfucosaminyltransferase
MTNRKIVHCMHAEKFIEPFIEFVANNFDSTRNVYLIRESDKFPTQVRSNVHTITEQAGFFANIFFYIGWLNSAEKIIFHGLFHKELFLMLFVQPWLLKKSYWIIWGGDLYRKQYHQRRLKSDIFEVVRAFVFKRMGHFVTHVKGDYELAKSWYGANGKYHECLMYPSNLYKGYVIPPKAGEVVNILVGNSATHTNNHLEIFEKLAAFKNRNIMIYCPLSYGTPANNADCIAKLGKEMFGDKFIPLLEFMPFEKYLELLGQIDIAVFAHKRQQAMGNTITLLGLGKKVYMRTDVSSWTLFSQLGLSISDVAQLDISTLNEDRARENKEIIAEYFSERKLIEQLTGLLQ